MKILVFNAGSTSLRFAIINLTGDYPQGMLSPGDLLRNRDEALFHRLDDFSQYHTLASGIVQDIGSQAVLKEEKNKKTIDETPITAKDYGEATKRIWEWLEKQNPDAIKDIDAIGHRLVHGGYLFSDHVLIDDDAISKIETLVDIAPLHNPPAIEVMQAARSLFPKTPMVAVFDTVFHRTIPEIAWRYGLPLELADKHQIRRYGFHGISHQYLARRYAQITERPLESIKIITLHLEGGCSATAVKNGKSIDTSMGFTPLEGLMMGKRCGDLDPAIVGYLAEQEETSVAEVEAILNSKSGLLGLSGLSHDTRKLKDNLANKRVNLAFAVFSYRIRKYLGAYLAALNGAEAIVFGGGIGENTPLVRKLVCQELEWCGLTLDSELNEKVIDCEGGISTDDSSLHAYVIPTQEAIAIARATILTYNRLTK
jgi:acetate kinase